MSTRPRRAAAVKQQQYRIIDDDDDDDDDNTESSSKKDLGGVLASLSHNVPVTKKNRNSKKKLLISDRSETSDATPRMATPNNKISRSKKNNPNEKSPPPASVVVAKMQQIFSPPTQAYSSNNRRRPSEDDTIDPDRHMDDGISAMSCDFASPPFKTRIVALEKPIYREPVEEENDSDDDNTVPTERSFKGEELVEDVSFTEEESEIVEDPNETILEEEEDDDVADEDEDEATLLSEADSYSVFDEDDEDDEDDDDDDDDDFEPEDDEYDPDEDEDSASEDELEDYVEEQKPVRGRQLRRTNAKEHDKENNTQAADTKKKTRKSAGKKTQMQKSTKSTESSPLQSPSSPTLTRSIVDIQTPARDDDDDDDDTEAEAEETPAVKRFPNLQSLNFASPEDYVAVVVDDDSDDDDILVAAIIDDDQSEADNDQESVGVASPNRTVVDDNEEAEFDDYDEDNDVVDLQSGAEDDQESVEATSPNQLFVDDEEEADLDADDEDNGVVDLQFEAEDDQDSVEATSPNRKLVDDNEKADLDEDKENAVDLLMESGLDEETKTKITDQAKGEKSVRGPHRNQADRRISSTDANAESDEDSFILSNGSRQTKGPRQRSSEKKAVPPKESPIRMSTPQNKKSKPRKSFYRQEGVVKRGKWMLGAKIGVGSFGVVHVGMNTESGKLMAVKVFKMDGAVMKDIRTEVELMRSLKHENIVRYLGAQRDNKNLHIFQEWVPGGSVASLLSRYGAFSMQVIRSYLSQTLSGLVYLHESNIMHRDIKGSNILVNDEGVVKLADFGASKKLANLQDNMMMSLTVRGTPYFMAPEVFEEKYSAKADVWGIGCVAYQMVTGSPPWRDEGFTNPISLFNHIKKTDGPPPIKFSDGDQLTNEEKKVRQLFLALVRSCFQQDPSMRPTATALQDHPFFLEMHDGDDEEATQYRGLFSPGSESTSSWESARSPAMFPRSSDTPSPQRVPTPSPQQLTRSKSVVQWKTSFMSPPRPRRNRERGSPNQIRSSPHNPSPKPDTSAWPDWARIELKKKALFSKSPVSKRADPDLSDLMGSLALSEDSGNASNNPYARKPQGRASTIGSTAHSNLIGLNLLDKNNPAFEI